jgi:hypothetical protein
MVCFMLQLKKLQNAALIAAKHTALMEDLKRCAQEAADRHGLKCTCGNITPSDRFVQDNDVPVCTRYKVPSTLIDASYKATTEEHDDMDEWDRQMERLNAQLKKVRLAVFLCMFAPQNVCTHSSVSD